MKFRILIFKPLTEDREYSKLQYFDEELHIFKDIEIAYSKNWPQYNSGRSWEEK